MRPPPRIQFAPGVLRSLIPLMIRIPPRPQRIVMSGTFTVYRLEIRIPGTEPRSSHAVA